jgi:nucleoside-diphosphate-sugar epimerase
MPEERVLEGQNGPGKRVSNDPMSILVTGGFGLIGSALTRMLLEPGVFLLMPVGFRKRGGLEDRIFPSQSDRGFLRWIEGLPGRVVPLGSVPSSGLRANPKNS